MIVYFRLIVGILEILDGSFTLYNNDDKLEQHKPLSISVATILLTLPSPPALQIHSKSLLSALHPSKQSYHSYKVFIFLLLINYYYISDYL